MRWWTRIEVVDVVQSNRSVACGTMSAILAHIASQEIVVASISSFSAAASRKTRISESLPSWYSVRLVSSKTSWRLYEWTHDDLRPPGASLKTDQSAPSLRWSRQKGAIPVGS